MSNVPNTQTTLSGFLKPIFGDLQWLLPPEAQLQKEIKFTEGDSVGLYFAETVLVRPTWSITYGGSSGDAYDLVDALPAKTQQAQITPFSAVLRTQYSYQIYDQAPDGDLKKSFMGTGKFSAKELAMQMRRLIEISIICGQEGFGIVSAYNSGTTTTTFTDASFRPGIVSILEGAYVDVFQTNLTTARSLGNLISAVNVDNKTVTFSTAAVTADPQATDVFFIRSANAGSGTYNEMVGLRKQAGAVTGTVFNIDKATYSQWRGNTASSIGPFTAGALLQAATKAINRGFQGRALAILSPKAWAVLNSRIVSQQVFDQSYAPTQQSEGVDKILVRGNGVILECISHAYMAEGECLIVPKDYVKRIGALMENSKVDADGMGGRDVSFTIPGSPYEFIFPVLGKTAVELQCRTSQAVYCQRPAWMVLGTGITY